MVKPGDVIKDNDPRMPNRMLRVVYVGDGKAVCETSPPVRRSLISLTRIYDDGKARKSGFTVWR
jgi:hypothetical protein